MSPRVADSRLGPEFDDFLFTRVGEDSGGQSLSVVTMLARLDVDPWQAAARLAALPRESAALELAAMLAELPALGLAPHDILSTADRLAAMLPRATAFRTPSNQTLFSGGKAASRKYANVLFLAIYLLTMLATQFVMVTLAPTRGAAPLASPVSALSPMASMPSSG
jgi:hypothetical protein